MMNVPNFDETSGRKLHWCLSWVVNEHRSKKEEEVRRYLYTRDSMVFLKTTEKQIPPVFLYKYIYIFINKQKTPHTTGFS